jgi:NADPH:quinone reductase-like Zn-dependent oxidoreductase
MNLGAETIIMREDFEPWIINRFKTCFAGAVDTVGGVILENIIKSTNTMGVIASCGNVASPKLDLTVFLSS